MITLKITDRQFGLIQKLVTNEAWNPGNLLMCANGDEEAKARFREWDDLSKLLMTHSERKKKQ